MGKKRRNPVDIFNGKHIKLDSGCWLWLGYIGNSGYGYISTHLGTQLAHRWSYNHFIGTIKEGLTIDHKCRNVLCVNPDHLEQITLTENIQRAPISGVAVIESNKTHCPKGHSYLEYGIWTKNGFTKTGLQKKTRRCSVCYPNFKQNIA